ncbi:MAG TPA: hypothetical protein VGM88_03680 [Kofleriaceae bacterium]|jgi:hypothetical protein
MRALLVVAALAGTAAADSKSDVEALVRAHLTASTGKQKGFYKTLASEYQISDASGFLLSLFSCEPKDACDNDVPVFEQSWFGKFSFANIRPIVWIDPGDQVATFYATADLTADLLTQGGAAKGKTQFRLAGVAKREGGSWRVAGAKYALALPDAALLRGEDLHDSVFAPTSPVEKAVASWFGHLASHMSANAIGANGTAPAELATAPAAMARLAASWDKLSLTPTSFTTIDLGTVAIVLLDVTFRAKAHPVSMSCAIVAVKQGDTWSWSAIDFGARFGVDQALH